MSLRNLHPQFVSRRCSVHGRGRSGDVIDSYGVQWHFYGLVALSVQHLRLLYDRLEVQSGENCVLDDLDVMRFLPLCFLRHVDRLLVGD